MLQTEFIHEKALKEKETGTGWSLSLPSKTAIFCSPMSWPCHLGVSLGLPGPVAGSELDPEPS